jgi:sugar fermentation stimulation protein A
VGIRETQVFAFPFTAPVSRGILVRRYKRFLADVETPEGMQTVHCPNSGSMLGCTEPGSPVLISYHGAGKRKLPYTLEAVRVAETWVGVNTSNPNRAVGALLRAQAFPPLAAYAEVRAEAAVNKATRLDFLLSGAGLPNYYLEVKNVTLRRGDTALFPDCKTERGAKHMRELAALADHGHKAGVLFFIQRGDCARFAPAADLDAAYAQALRTSHAAGVDVFPLLVDVDEDGLTLHRLLPYALDAES